MSYLSLKNINKIYPGAVQAVFDFNLDVQEGEFIVLVGPSGCGKSTVLRMIAGLEEISGGDMVLAGKRINDLSPSDRQTAMVFQDYALYGNMTVYQNIGFSLTIKGKPPQDIHERVMDVSKTVDLYDYLNRFPKALSGGQKQRVAMGRSLAKQARVLLMDEPLSNLDAKLRQQTRRELSVLHNDLHPTIVYVTHDQIEAMTLADKIVVMNEGRIQQIGTPYEIYHTPANIFTSSFIGTPPINLAAGYISGEDFNGVNENKEPVLKCKVPQKISSCGCASNTQLVLGLRPETLQIGEKTSEEECAFNATIEAYEFLGAEYYASLNANGCIFTARIPANVPVSKGQKVQAVFNIHKAHFFDKATGLRLKGNVDE
ncbi:MAG: ABC transporter ATP-binding protein [Treponema sp.]|nr:ABC transporter ATP-binding protein [Treponema sp.]